MGQSLSCMHYHFIFSTKGRAALIVPAVQQQLYDYIGGIIKSEDGQLLAAGGTRNHMHLLASLRPRRAVADVLRKAKANSSRWVHIMFPNMMAFGWQDGYGAFTVSYSGIEQVREYIQQQEEHHRKMTFEEELVAILERHKLTYDPQYVWD